MDYTKNTGTGELNNSGKDSRPAALTANADQVAAMLGVSVRQVWRLHATGRLPRAIRLGHCVRWRRAEIEAFVEAGCPTRQEWEAMHVS
ncbi:MAG: helix-turn-helix transcriptional regulator [Planctomycetota bacterium]|jgi:predicted DNA-binding transcriptional regulator AlpA